MKFDPKKHNDTQKCMIFAVTQLLINETKMLYAVSPFYDHWETTFMSALYVASVLLTFDVAASAKVK